MKRQLSFLILTSILYLLIKLKNIRKPRRKHYFIIYFLRERYLLKIVKLLKILQFFIISEFLQNNIFDNKIKCFL